MMKEPSVLLSFIIPVYNGEKTIKQTLDSIFRQNSQIEFEVITIDDGSKDSSLDILQSYSHPLCIQDIQNSGVSVARNTGLALAKGKYVFFLDCDDTLDEHFFQNIIPILEQNPEMVCGRYCKTDGVNKEYRLSLDDGIINLNNHAGLQDFLFGPLSMKVNGTTSNKIYSMNIINQNHIYFIEGKTMSEDWMFNARYLENIKTIHTTSSNVFYYFKNPNSVTHTYNRKFVDSIIGFIKEIKSLSTQYQYKLDDNDLTLFYLKRWFGVVSNEVLNPNKKEGYQQFKRYLSQEYFQTHLKQLPNSMLNKKELAYKYLTLFHLESLVYQIVYSFTKR